MIEITKIKESDNKKAEIFCSGIFEEMGWDKRFFQDYNNLSEKFSKNREVFFVGKDGEEIVGSAGLQELSEKDALMEMFYMAKDFRGRGLARMIFEKIKKFAKEKGYENIVLDLFLSNERARKFYEKQGFFKFSPGIVKNWEDTKYPDFFEFQKIKL